ncbi:MAG: prepilin-type N-terminal cleavage/methylation domain-containing protein [Phycisphaeraceae bacterium]
MATRHSKTRAFTLIEVLVVVAIVGIAGAIVVPSMISAGTMGVQAAGRMIISDLLIAQNDAVARQRPRRVVFDQDNERYWLTDETGTMIGVNWKRGDATAGNYILDFRTDDRFQGVVIENVDFGGDQTIEFDALGGPDSGGSVDVVFKQFRYRINVATMTGRVTIAPVTP